MTAGCRGHAVWGAAAGAVLGCCLGGASDGAGRLTAGCCLGRSSGGAVGGAGVQSLLSGVYAGVFFFLGGGGVLQIADPL